MKFDDGFPTSPESVTSSKTAYSTTTLKTSRFPSSNVRPLLDVNFDEAR